MNGCSTCGYVGGLDMLPCDRHCRPCHIYCGCARSKERVLEIAEGLRHIDGYAGTLYDPGNRMWHAEQGHRGQFWGCAECRDAQALSAVRSSSEGGADGA